ALKCQLAPTLDEFVALAPRRVIMASTETDTDEFVPVSVEEGSWKNYIDPIQRERAHREAFRLTNNARHLSSLSRLDAVGARAFSDRLPLDLLRQVAGTEEALPSHLASEFGLVVGARSVLPGRFDVAREFAPAVVRDHPGVAPQLDAFAKSADG